MKSKKKSLIGNFKVQILMQTICLPLITHLLRLFSLFRTNSPVVCALITIIISSSQLSWGRKLGTTKAMVFNIRIQEAE